MTRSWSAFPYALVRVPGVARSRLREYRYDAVLDLHRRATELADRLRSDGARLLPSLYALVPRLPAGARGGVLAAQRALFGQRALPEGPWLRAVARLDASLADDLAAWSARRDECAELAAARDRRFDCDRRTCDAALLALCREPHVERGLELANPALAHKLSQIDERAARTADGRKVVRRAMRYLLRASLKPVPLGFFCSTALAPLTTGRGPATSVGVRTPQLQVNREFLARTFGALLGRPALRARTNVRLAALAFADGDDVWAYDATRGYQPADGTLYGRLVSLPSGGIPWAESGLTDAELTAALSAGLVELDWGVSEEEADDLDVLLQLVCETGLTDFELLGLIPILTTLRSATARMADSTQRRDALAEINRCATLLPGGDRAAALPVVFEDTWCTSPPLPDIAPFLDEIAHFSAGLLWPHAMPDEHALVALFEHFNPGAGRVPLLRFHRQYLGLCSELQLGSDHWANWPQLCRWLGIAPFDPIPGMQARVEHALATTDAGELRYPVAPSDAGEWEQGGPLRLSVRVAPAPLGRFHPVFWGGESMSLFPRYARLPFPGADLTEALETWFARWPTIADIHGALGRNVDIRPCVTRQTVEAPVTRAAPEALRLRDLDVCVDDARHRLMLVDRSGRPVAPRFLGVSSGRLTPIHQFLFHVSGRRTSFFECAIRSVGQLSVDRLREPPPGIVRLPLVSLGDHIVLSGPAFIVPGAALPPIGPVVDRAAFFRFHDWLGGNGLPPLAQVWAYGRAPVWVDLGHPLGVSELLARVRGASAFMMRPPLLADGDLTMRTAEGAFETEYYVEFAAGGTT